MSSDTRLFVVAGLLGGLLGACFAVAYSVDSRPLSAPMRAVDSPDLAHRTNTTQLAAGEQQPPSTAPSSEENLATVQARTLVPAASSTPMLGEVDRDRSLAKVYAMVAWSQNDVDSRTTDRCVVGDAIACLCLGDLESSRETLADKRRSQAYFERAFAILVLKCKKREPDACIAIARMHAFGVGLAKNKTAETALIQRAQELCRSRPGKTCTELAKH